MDETGERVGPATAGVVETDVDDSVALFQPHSGTVFVLNPTAADVWRLSDGALTLDEVVTALARAYDIEPEVIRGDVAAAVDRLRSDGLLAPAEG
ncbi:MAG TPA: HPr-rel-A system PqqD family peptide chaperone [Acidimicrobiales bacterium]|nr:HPr-rel-A system PqqD family peptide chaperone [Acidimicrobiales bacterium]